MLNNMIFWSIGLNILVLIVSISGFIKIMNNDLKHLEINVNEIKNTLFTIETKLDNNAERISKIEGKCSANHNN